MNIASMFQDNKNTSLFFDFVKKLNDGQKTKKIAEWDTDDLASSVLLVQQDLLNAIEKGHQIHPTHKKKKVNQILIEFFGRFMNSYQIDNIDSYYNFDGTFNNLKKERGRILLKKVEEFEIDAKNDKQQVFASDEDIPLQENRAKNFISQKEQIASFIKRILEEYVPKIKFGEISKGLTGAGEKEIEIALLHLSAMFLMFLEQASSNNSLNQIKYFIEYDNKKMFKKEKSRYEFCIYIDRVEKGYQV